VLLGTRQILVARRTESVTATGHELSAEVNSIEPARNRHGITLTGHSGIHNSANR